MQGRIPSVDDSDGDARLYDPEHEFLGVGRAKPGEPVESFDDDHISRSDLPAIDALDDPRESTAVAKVNALVSGQAFVHDWRADVLGADAAPFDPRRQRLGLSLYAVAVALGG